MESKNVGNCWCGCPITTQTSAWPIFIPGGCIHGCSQISHVRIVATPICSFQPLRGIHKYGAMIDDASFFEDGTTSETTTGDSLTDTPKWYTVESRMGTNSARRFTDEEMASAQAAIEAAMKEIPTETIKDLLKQLQSKVEAEAKRDAGYVFSPPVPITYNEIGESDTVMMSDDEVELGRLAIEARYGKG